MNQTSIRLDVFERTSQSQTVSAPQRTRRGRRSICRAALRALCEMVAQFVDRGKSQRALRQFGFDRAVDIERIAHAVDDAGFQDRDRLAWRLAARAPASGLRLRLRLRSASGAFRRLRFRRPHGIEIARLRLAAPRVAAAAAVGARMPRLVGKASGGAGRCSSRWRWRWRRRREVVSGRGVDGGRLARRAVGIRRGDSETSSCSVHFELLDRSGSAHPDCAASARRDGASARRRWAAGGGAARGSRAWRLRRSAERNRRRGGGGMAAAAGGSNASSRTAGLHRRARRQHLGDALQLADRRAERDDDEAADGSRGPGDDERIAEAEFIDRNAVSDHPDAQRRQQWRRQQTTKLTYALRPLVNHHYSA